MYEIDLDKVKTFDDFKEVFKAMMGPLVFEERSDGSLDPIRKFFKDAPEGEEDTLENNPPALNPSNPNATKDPQERAAFEQIAGRCERAEGQYQMAHDGEATIETVQEWNRSLVTQISDIAKRFATPKFREIQQLVLKMSSEPNREVFKKIKVIADEQGLFPGGTVGDTTDRPIDITGGGGGGVGGS